MYTWEIKKMIQENNGVLDSETYNFICDSSPQILSIKYEPFGDCFHLRTSDDNSDFIFKVEKNKNAMKVA